MKNLMISTKLSIAMTTVLLTLAGGQAFAAGTNAMTPELAAKREMVRKQHEQQITPAQRKAAAAALKAERLKIHQARQAAKQARQEVQLSTPVTTDNK